jgi:RNase H-fold protein (predicted Holliday junction resolvase)
MSTKDAQDIFISAGLRWKKRKEKIDQLAACLILQNYLDCADPSKNGRG